MVQTTLNDPLMLAGNDFSERLMSEGVKNSTMERLKQLVNRPEEVINLAETALLLAEEEYPHLDIGA